jgi:hypothetical protein
MSEQQNHEEGWETSVQNKAKAFSYPATPNIAANVRQRLRPSNRRNSLRWVARAAAMLVLIFIALMFVPEIRAGVLEILRLGTIRILPQNPTATTTTSPLGILSLLELTPVATLEDAQEIFGLPIYLPTSVRVPDRIFVMDDTPIIVFVWLVAGTEDQIEMSLHLLRSQRFSDKYYPWDPEITSVNGGQAFWLVNAHILDYFGVEDDEHDDWRRYVDMNVLIWEHDSATYRLETNLNLDEARQIAESLEEVTP